MSLYSLKTSGETVLQPWSHVLDLSGPGQGLARLAALYDKRPEACVSGALNIASTLDGPVQVARFGDLTLDGATITTSNPCRGLFVICDSLTTTGASSAISMTGKGCVNVDWEDYDLSIPQSIALSSDKVSLQHVLSMLRTKNCFVGDPQLWKDLAHAVTGGLVHGSNKIVDKSGLGAAGDGTFGVGNCGAQYWRVGGAGGAGASGPGGGSGGLASVNDNYTVMTMAGGGKGRSWRGGLPGSGRSYVGRNDNKTATPGGVLIVAVLNSVTLGSALVLSADGVQVLADPQSNYMGAPGGGLVKLLTPSTVSSNLTIRANGATTTAANSGCNTTGGAGPASQSTFTAWGL